MVVLDVEQVLGYGAVLGVEFDLRLDLGSRAVRRGRAHAVPKRKDVDRVALHNHTAAGRSHTPPGVDVRTVSGDPSIEGSASSCGLLL